MYSDLCCRECMIVGLKFAVMKVLNIAIMSVNSHHSVRCNGVMIYQLLG